MCYTGRCPYEYNKPDNEIGCRKPKGVECWLDDDDSEGALEAREDQEYEYEDRLCDDEGADRDE